MSDCDLRLRLDCLRSGQGFDARHGLTLDRAALSRVRQAARDWRRRLGLSGADQDGTAGDAGLVLAFAYPDRIARRRPGGLPRYALSGGQGAVFQDHQPLAACDWLVAAHLDGDRREARIFLAAPVIQADIETHFDDQIVQQDRIEWDRRQEMVVATRERRLFALVLDQKPLTGMAPDDLAQVMAQGVRQMGLDCLPWTPAAQTLRRRVAFVAAQDPDGAWPDLSDAALMQGLEQWLAPHLTGMMRRSHLARLEMAQVMRACLDWDKARRLDSLAPTHVTVPSGSHVPIDYDGDVPVLAVRLQEMFGLADTPCIAQGRVPLLLHLLSPARRPVQVTGDLAGFWASSYKAVKADLKGQYPKHWWPDDPMQAQPTARAKPRK